MESESRVLMNNDESCTTMSSSSSSNSLCESETEELQRLEQAPPFWRNPKKVLSKQLSMCETPRDRMWEKRRRRMLLLERERREKVAAEDLADEDLNELKGCIELGFGFNEEEGGHSLCSTLPALDLYFAVNRQLSPAALSPSSRSSSSKSLLVGRSSSVDSPVSDSESWKICSQGDDPQQVKTKLRHWAQAVACSVMQSSVVKEDREREIDR